MTSVLLVVAPGAPDLAVDLAVAGIHVAATSSAQRIVRDAVSVRADLVVAWEPRPTDALLPALADLQRHAPLPVLLFTSDASAETVDAALASGVHAHVVNGYAPARLRALVQLARVRYARERALRQEYEALQRRYDERRLVDRAKGILMRTRQVGEDEAFRLLRDASMRRHERVGALSQRVIDAARDAELVDRAGRLRMLSQQLVKLHALRCAAPDAPAWREAATRARQRVAEALGALGLALSRPTWGDLLGAVEQAWRALEPRLDAAPRAADLDAIDAGAEALLQAAERLTAVLQASSPLAAMLAVVDLAARQRMLSQRLAKQALLARLLDGDAAAHAAAGAAATIAALQTAQQRLRDATPGSPAIRDELDAAQRLIECQLAALRAASDADAAALGDDSEALLAVFERLAGRCANGVPGQFIAD